MQPRQKNGQVPEELAKDHAVWHAVMSNTSVNNLCSTSWIASLSNSEKRIHSQNGEDGVLAAIFKNIKVTKKTYVEFGTQDGMERNTRAMQETDGWSGLLMDGSHENPSINLHKEIITPNGIVGLLQKYKVSQTALGLLSVDVDSYDFWVLKKILEAGYQPDVIIHEVNSQLKQGGLYTVAPPEVTGKKFLIPGTYNFGASPEAFALLGAKHGYKMVYCENMGVNCFMVKGSLLADHDVACIASPVRKYPKYCSTCQPSNGIAFYELNSDLSIKNPKILPETVCGPAQSFVSGTSDKYLTMSGTPI